jgi:hypothetical protein
MANSTIARKARSIKRVNVKADPKLSIYIGRYSKRVHVDVRLTAAEERGLYNALVKRYGKS